MDNTLEARVRQLEIDRAEDHTLLEQHVKSCDSRNAMILKLVLWAFLGILVLVIESTFNIHIPNGIPNL